MRHLYTFLLLIVSLAAAQETVKPKLVGAPIPYPIIDLYNDSSRQIIMYKTQEKNDPKYMTIIARDSKNGKTLWKQHAELFGKPSFATSNKGKGVSIVYSDTDFEGCPGCANNGYAFRVTDGKLLREGSISLFVSKGILLVLPVVTPNTEFYELMDYTHELIFETINIKTAHKLAEYSESPDRKDCGISKSVYGPSVDIVVSGDNIRFDRQDNCGKFQIMLNWTTYPKTPINIVNKTFESK